MVNLITFDDGYRSTLTEALPWLECLGWPGVVFVPTAYVGGWNAFDDGIEPREAICSWDELHELQRAGVSIVDAPPRQSAGRSFNSNRRPLI